MESGKSALLHQSGETSLALDDSAPVFLVFERQLQFGDRASESVFMADSVKGRQEHEQSYLETCNPCSTGDERQRVLVGVPKVWTGVDGEQGAFNLVPEL